MKAERGIYTTREELGERKKNMCQKRKKNTRNASKGHKKREN